MFVLVLNLRVQTTNNNHDNHPNIEPSRFLLMGLEVRGNLEIGNRSLLGEVTSQQMEYLDVLLLSERILLASDRSGLGFDPSWDIAWNPPASLPASSWSPVQ